MTDGAGHCVFIVDDEAGVRASIQGLLKSQGMRSEVFETPQDFLQSKLSDGPSYLVFEVRFPAVKGLDFQRELVAHGIQMPIIFITGHGDSENAWSAGDKKPGRHGAWEAT